MRKLLFFASIVLCSMAILSSCNKSDEPGGTNTPTVGYAPVSAVGKTFVIGHYTIRGTGQSSCSVTLGSFATFVLTGTPTCSYARKDDNSAELKLNVDFKPKYSGLGYTSGSSRSTFNLTYDRDNGGTYTGYDFSVHSGGTLAGSGSSNINGVFSMF